MPQDQSLLAIKGRMLDFLQEEYSAVNSSKQDDIKMYGAIDSNRLFTFHKNVDFESLIKTIFLMMHPTISINGVVTMDGVQPNATYYGLDMLREYRMLTGKNPLLDPPHAQHVCTTAVLCLLRAAVGSSKYYCISKELLRSNQELKHGIPIVDFTHALIQKSYNELELPFQSGSTPTSHNRV